MAKIHLICGSTASGKSALALQLAEKTNGVIINADSRQLYAPLRILSARPSPEDEERAPHRLYGTLPGDAPCSVASWLRLAKMEIDWALSMGHTPIVTGGTGLYFKALMEGIADIPDIPPEVRAQARADLQAMGHAAFHARLGAVDETLGAKLKPGDTQRCLRAYEVWLGTGKPLSWWQAQGNKPLYDNRLFEIHKVMSEREALYAACDARFDAMLEAGALQEVRDVLSLGLPEAAPTLQVIGVPELSAYLRNEISLETASSQAKQATRNYAKRQLTWFRHQLT